MDLLYDGVLLPLLRTGFRIAALGNSKIKKGLEGRKHLLDEVRRAYAAIPPSTTRVVVHVASFGELEQAKPIIARIRDQFPEVHLHLTFFSPSGYENTIGKYSAANFISYSPEDGKRQVREFLDVVRPDLYLFVRYDVWPNLITELEGRDVPTVLFSATLSESSARGSLLVRSFVRRVYQKLDRILTTGVTDRERFERLGVARDHLAVVGDTRFDQVLQRKAASHKPATSLMNFASRARSAGKLVLVAGSTWPEDEAHLLELDAAKVALIIAPHEPSPECLDRLSRSNPDSIRLSQLDEAAHANVIIVDSIGKLFDLYRHADIAYVGGGFSAGVHNTLEAAVWGSPVLCGPNHLRSREIADLMKAGGAFEISERSTIASVVQALSDSRAREQAGAAALQHVVENSGATDRIFSVLEKYLGRYAT